MRFAPFLATSLVVVALGSVTIAVAQEAQPNVADSGLVSLDSLLNTRISTAAKYAQTSNEAAASVTVVTAEEISRYGYRTLADVLARVPGFYLTDDRQFINVGVRGFGRPSDYNNRILVLLDGNTANAGLIQAADVGPEMVLNLDALERVEIVRGPGSALYGTGAVFAVVNLITRQGKDLDGAHATGAIGSYGSSGLSGVAGLTRRGIDLMVSGVWDRVNGQALSFPGFNAPATNFGIADHRDWERNSGILGKLTWGGFSVTGRASSRSSGAPLPWEGFVFNDSRNRQQHSNSSGEVRYERDLSSRVSLMARAHYQRYRGAVTNAMTDSTAQSSDLASDVYGAELAGRWDAASWSRFTLGGEYVDTRRAEIQSSINGFPVFGASAPNSVVSLYAQEQVALTRRLSVLGGVRADLYSTGDSPVVPRAGVIYSPGRSTTLKVLYGEAFRVPNLFETSLEQGTGGQPPVGPELEPERIRTLEAVWSQRLSPWLQGSVSIYHYSGNNLIDQVIDSSTFTVTYANVAKVRANGAELGFQARLPDGFMGYAGLELTHADGAGDVRLSNSPGHQIKIGASRPVLGINLAAEIRHEGSRGTPRGNETSSFLMTDLTATGHLRIGGFAPLGRIGDRADYGVQVRNVFNVTYRYPAALLYREDTFVQNGRSVQVRLGYRF